MSPRNSFKNCYRLRVKKPTLLTVNNYHYPRGGAEVVFLEQNRLFENNGYEVVPFCMTHPDNLASPYSDYFVDEIEFGSNYSLLQSALRVPKVIYSREAQQKLNRLIDKTAPDAAALHNIYHHISPSILSTLRNREIPVVMTLHDLKLACPSYKMLASDGICERCKGGKLRNVIRHRCVKDSLALSAVVYLESSLHRLLGTYEKCVDRFIVPSQFFKTKLSEWGIAADQMVHIPNFVDAQAFEPGEHAGDYFLYFGRLAPEKGVSTLIEAAANARVKLKLVGTGPEETALKASAEGLAADVEFCGYQTGDALHTIVRNARAVVLPSEWYENGPMSVLESYALGTPVLGANIGGIPEMIRDGETGGIFPSENAQELAQVLSDYAALDDSAVRDHGRNARQWVSEAFSARTHFDKVSQVLKSVGLS